MNSYSIKVSKQYFNFASAHFLTFADGTRERLHGHNYRVQVEGRSQQMSGDMLFNFLDIKPIVRALCDSLDHAILLPAENRQIQYQKEGQQLELIFDGPGGKERFSFPAKDAILLPLPNITSEYLAIYLAHELHHRIQQTYAFTFNELEVEVEESPGQSASYILRSPQARTP